MGRLTYCVLAVACVGLPQVVHRTATQGPVGAKVQLRLVRAGSDSPTHFLGLQRQDATPVRPAGLREVPADAPRDPAYFVVHVGDRDVPGVTYRSARSLNQVKLYLDTDGDGSLSDEREYVGRRVPYIQVTATYQFGPVGMRQGILSPGGDVFYVECSNGLWLTLHPTFLREGTVALDGRTYRIALVDIDFDGRFNETFVPPAESSRQPGCDVLAIDLDRNSKFSYGHAGDSEIMPLSGLVEVAGKYYAIEVAEDGSEISFRRVQPQFGFLDVGGEEVTLGLWSDAAQQRWSGSGRSLTLPVGRYGVVSLELTRKDFGDRWTFTLGKGGPGQLSDFEIRPGQTTKFQIGPPFTIHSSLQRAGRDVLVSFDLEGRGGERYIPGAKKNDAVVAKPTFKIVDAAGRTVHSGQFEYG